MPAIIGTESKTHLHLANIGKRFIFQTELRIGEEEEVTTMAVLAKGGVGKLVQITEKKIGLL